MSKCQVCNEIPLDVDSAKRVIFGNTEEHYNTFVGAKDYNWSGQESIFPDCSGATYTPINHFRKISI